MDTGKPVLHDKADPAQHAHSPGHDHSHHAPQQHAHSGGHHGHDHASRPHDKAFAIGASVNLGFALAELGFGFAANSVALIADATHNMGDVLGLLLGWMAV